MIVEVAEFRVRPDEQEAFGAALQQGIDTVLSKAKGYQAHRILHGIESPGRYLLVVEWASLEDHTVGFRESPAFAEWRAIVGPFFAQPPLVEHFSTLSGGGSGGA